MSVDKDPQGLLFVPGEDVADQSRVQTSSIEELQRPTRRYLARTATADLEPQVLEGMPEPPKKTNRELQRLTKRAALSPVMSPGYWVIDEAKFAGVTEEDYEISSSGSLSARLYQRTDQSMRQTGVGSRWVILSPGEKTAILNVPFEYAAGAEAKYRTRNAATFKSHDVAQREALEEGAKALETRLERMQSLADGYTSNIAKLRLLKSMLEHPWMANAPSGMDVREVATTLREGVRELISNIAKVDNWSEEKLKRALTGLDMRLTAGDTRIRQQEKTKEWRQLTSMYGNYLIAKKYLVRDRITKCHDEIGRRRRIVLK